jgi:hypothetical protein
MRHRSPIERYDASLVERVSTVERVHIEGRECVRVAGGHETPSAAPGRARSTPKRHARHRAVEKQID